MKIANLVRLYRVRLRARLFQECFAALGIAAGVALLFASQVASQSLSGGAAQLNAGVVGRATLQLSARSAAGLPEGALARVRALAGVIRAAPLLETSANALGPRGSESVLLVGADESLATLGGKLVRDTKLTPFGGIGAVVIPAPLAHRLGVTKFGAEVTLQAGGRSSRAPLYAQLRGAQVGSLVESPIVVAPLEYAQEVAGLKGRVTRILIEPRPGRETSVRAALERQFSGSANVQSADYDQRLFDVAASATNQSTTLFALISALVGFLFAFDAVLLTVPQRRRLIGDLRGNGYTPRAVVAVLLFDALVLGAVACAAGLALGEELSIHLFRATPGYLSSAFAVGSQRVVSVSSVAIALGGGMLAAIVAVLSPLRGILSRDPLATPVERERTGVGRRAGWVLALGGPAFLAIALIVLVAFPREAIVGMLALVAALLLLLPFALDLVLLALRSIAPAIVSPVPLLSLMELRSGRARSLAVAATGAVAVFGSVAITGARGDLLTGLDDAAHDMNAFTNLWVAPAGSSNLLVVQPFRPVQLGRLRALPGVSAVRLYRGGLLDYGERRIWVIAPPAQATPLLPPSQISEGNRARAEADLRAGGWAVVSLALAREHHLHIGGTVTLPSPHPRPLRVAAISTNIGWAPGAVIMSAVDYARRWGGAEAAAYNVLVRPGFPVVLAQREVRRALGAGSGLAVQSAEQHADRQRALTRQGLARLTQIATLILLAAILAMAAAIGAMLWQRRPRLAKLKLEGFSRGELWRVTLLESLLVLAAGCLSGALLGVLGQQLLDRALAQVVNYPVAPSVAAPTTAWIPLAVVAVAGVVLSVPGWLAVRVPASLALQD